MKRTIKVFLGDEASRVGTLKEILARIEQALSQWRGAGAALGMTRQELDQFAEAFEHPEREAARKVLRRA